MLSLDGGNKNGEIVVNLESLGWNSFFSNTEEYISYTEKGLKPARILLEHKSRYDLGIEGLKLSATIAGRLRFKFNSKDQFPVVGDWVMVSALEGENRAVIFEILPRRTVIARKAAGPKTEAQVLAANVDTIFVVSGLDRDFNLHRIERYLVIAWNSGAQPVLVLNKEDLCPDVPAYFLEAQKVAPAVPIIITQANIGKGIDGLKPYLGGGKTAVLIGSSGVGKSSIINDLAGREVQKIKELSKATHKGKHATTQRPMIFLPDGGIIIDTPGMRELQIWEGEDGTDEVFSDIEKLALNCKFTDCQHETEPGCAVLTALEEGSLDIDRFENFRKLQKEAAYLERKQNQRAALEEKKRWKKISQEVRLRLKEKGRE